MLSRRSVRIKIMQVLYGAAVSETTLTPEIAEKLYRNKVRQTYNLYLYTLLQLQRVLEYTDHDAAFRQTKQLKQPEDLAFDARMLHNPVAKSLMENANLNNALVTQNLRYLYPHDFPKKFYYDFIKIDSVKTFLNADIATLTTDDYVQNILYYSGANNPAYICRQTDENTELIVLQPTKQSIGYISGDIKPYEHQKFALQAGDTIYLFSDGFVFNTPK